MIKKLILICFLFNFLLSSEDIQNNTILSNIQNNIINTKKNIIKKDKNINKKEWLGIVNFNSSVTRKKNNENDLFNYELNYNQEIFNFGGIYYIIKTSEIKEQYELMNLNITYSDYINKIYSIIIDLKIFDEKIRKRKLKIKNQEITIRLKTEEYKAGQIDISDLNKEIIENNVLKESLVNLIHEKENTAQSLEKYSDLNYKKIKLPGLRILKKDDFFDISKKLKLASYEIELKKYLHKKTKTNYYPKLFLNTNVSYANNDSYDYQSNYSYGLKLTLPFDFSSNDNIEKSQLNYLLAKKERELKKLEEKIKYNSILNNIGKYKNLLKIAQDDIILYNKLLKETKEEYNAGFKTINDIDILSNTKKIRFLDIKLNEFYIQKEIISLYF